MRVTNCEVIGPLRLTRTGCQSFHSEGSSSSVAVIFLLRPEFVGKEGPPGGDPLLLYVLLLRFVKARACFFLELRLHVRLVFAHEVGARHEQPDLAGNPTENH